MMSNIYGCKCLFLKCVFFKAEHSLNKIQFSYSDLYTSIYSADAAHVLLVMLEYLPSSLLIIMQHICENNSPFTTGTGFLNAKFLWFYCIMPLKK